MPRANIPTHMGMQWLETELRETGDSQDVDRANQIAAMLADRGKDFPLPGTEQLSGAKKFSREARIALETGGFRIYELTGQTTATIPTLGGQINPTWAGDWPQIHKVESRQSEIAIIWGNPFLPDTKNENIAKQKVELAKFNRLLSQTVPGVKAILGNALDYAELAARSADLLFDGRTRTTTLLPWGPGPYGSGNYIVTVGQCEHPQIPKETIFFGLTHGEPQRYERLAPIIIPK